MRRLLSFAAVVCLAASGVGAGRAVAATGHAARAHLLMNRGNAHPDHAVSSSIRPAAAKPNSPGLTIVPTYDTSITNDLNAAGIEAGIKSAINELEKRASAPITVNILFENVNDGLGGSSTFINNVSYAAYRSDLLTAQTLSTVDNRALATLPVGPNNPVNGGANVLLTLPLLRAVGETALGDNGGGFDSTISLNVSIMNVSRTGAQDPDKYDLKQVALHEITEVLGAGGGGSGIGDGDVGSLDLYRYTGPGARSYTTDPNVVPFFSINGGQKNRGYFNQSGNGDYADWDDALNGAPRVQDAFSTPNVQLDLVRSELVALDVVGYNVVYSAAT